MKNTENKINNNSLAAMMCGQTLTDEQRKDVQAFNNSYDKKLKKLSTRRRK